MGYLSKAEAYRVARRELEKARYSHTAPDKFGLTQRVAKDGRTMTSVGYNVINPKAGHGRTQDALRRQRDRVVRLPLVTQDSDTVGDKYTTCSWGMCDDSLELWPDPDDHIWPDDFVNYGRVAPRGTGACPMDMRVTRDIAIEESRVLGDGSGCFYTCRVFQRGLKTPTREEALELYDTVVQYRECTEGRLTKEDDPGEGAWTRDYFDLERHVSELMGKQP